MQYVLAKISNTDIEFISYPNLITRDLTKATKFSEHKIKVNGFSYITLDEANKQIKKLIAQDG